MRWRAVSKMLFVRECINDAAGIFYSKVPTTMALPFSTICRPLAQRRLFSNNASLRLTWVGMNWALGISPLAVISYRKAFSAYVSQKKPFVHADEQFLSCAVVYHCVQNLLPQA